MTRNPVWNAPDTTPSKPGTYKATVFPPECDAHFPGRRPDREQWRRHWNGQRWSRAWSTKWRSELQQFARHSPTQLDEAHCRVWWRQCREVAAK